MRIVITGLGIISPLGHDVETFKSRLFSGDSGVGPLTITGPTPLQTPIAAEVRGYDPADHFDKGQLAQLDRFCQFAVLSARQAVADAGIEFSGELAERTAVVHGTGVGGQNTQDDNYRILYADDGKRVHPFTIPKLMPNAGASQITMDLGITGPAFTTATACASAGHAIGLAMLLLRAGMADVAVTGGAESAITYGTMKGWDALRVTAKSCSRPFSADRGGMVVGEGGASLVIETLEHAQARGARIYAELTGFGMSSDAGNIVQPTRSGPVSALRGALRDAGLEAEAVQYINAHGTGTAQNDPTETAAIREVFGAHADRLAVSSTKSMHGHLLGAAAAIEAVATTLALMEQTAPATINFGQPDPECDLDYVPNEARPMSIQNALSNSFAFGGLNTVLAFRKFD
jgi:nodulation protein E